MSLTIMRYTLQHFADISFSGFDFAIPEETMNLISSLSMEVGSPSYIKTPVFQKRDPAEIANSSLAPQRFGSSRSGNGSNSNNYTTSNGNGNTNINPNTGIRKRRNLSGKPASEVTNEDWESLRSFQTTRIERKSGVDGEIDQIRLLLNKLSDKTFPDIRDKIFGIIEQIVETLTGSEEEERECLNKVGVAIFQIASSNKFYSKLYAELYSALLTKFEFMRPTFDHSFATFSDIFNHIEYFDAEKDYDKFCEMNKVNDRRKALSTFFVNLTLNGIISQDALAQITCNLMKAVVTYIAEPNRKNEVDEITENIALLYHKDFCTMFEKSDTSYKVNEMTIKEIFVKLAKSKAKDYHSLSSKSIFKYMDLIEE